MLIIDEAHPDVLGLYPFDAVSLIKAHTGKTISLATERRRSLRLYYEEPFYSKLDEARKISEFDWVTRYGRTREAWAKIDDAMMAQALASNIGKTEARSPNSRVTCARQISGNTTTSA